MSSPSPLGPWRDPNRTTVLLVEDGVGFGGSVVSAAKIVRLLGSSGFEIQCVVLHRNATVRRYLQNHHCDCTFRWTYERPGRINSLLQAGNRLGPLVKRAMVGAVVGAESTLRVLRRRALRRIVNATRPHLVVFNNGFDADLVRAATAGNLERPVIVHARGFSPPLLRVPSPDHAPLLIANSRAVRDSYVKQGWPAHRTAVVYNSFDLHNQRPSMPPSDDRSLRVALFGTLEPWKGHELFLKAAAVIALEHPTVHFFIVGGETLAHAGHASTIRRVIHELALSSRVTMLGHREDAAAVMTAMDVIVHCSVEAEPFGNVIVEAMSLGKAVIAADEGGPREILQNNVTGLLVAPRDPGALADAIRRLLGSREDRTRLGTCAAVAAAERFDHSRFIRELGALYRTEASGVES